MEKGHALSVDSLHVPSPGWVRGPHTGPRVSPPVLIAYNLGNLWRRLGLPKRIDTWSLTSLQQRLMKTGGRLVKHARYYWVLLAEGHLTRRLFGAIVRRLEGLPGPAG
jgi:DDE family transposase